MKLQPAVKKETAHIALGVAVGVFYVTMPICGVINILYTILNIYDICKGKKEAA